MNTPVDDRETNQQDNTRPLAYATGLARQKRMRVLLLAGTAEARHISYALTRESNIILTVSLARPERIPYKYGWPVRIGGWGGYDAFRQYLESEQIDAVIDATHPFADKMGHRTAKAVKELGIEAIRFMRPAWMPSAVDNWTFLNSAEEAANNIPENATVFLATGRRDLKSFENLAPRRVICRIKEAPDDPIPLANAEYHVARNLVSVDQEISIFEKFGVDWLVTRNSGGQGSWPKLEAARTLGLPVAMIRRPPPADLLKINSVAETLNWIKRRR